MLEPLNDKNMRPLSHAFLPERVVVRAPETQQIGAFCVYGRTPRVVVSLHGLLGSKHRHADQALIDRPVCEGPDNQVFRVVSESLGKSESQPSGDLVLVNGWDGVIRPITLARPMEKENKWK